MEIVETVVEFMAQQGVSPFTVPAIGSHDGATAQGQRALLASHGIIEEVVIRKDLTIPEQAEEIGLDPERNLVPDLLDWEGREEPTALHRMR